MPLIYIAQSPILPGTTAIDPIVVWALDKVQGGESASVLHPLAFICQD